MTVWGALGLGALMLGLLWWSDLTRKRDRRDSGDSGGSGDDWGDGDCGGGDGGGD